MLISEARELTKKWQDRLGLKDWIIKVRWMKPGDDKEFGLTDEIQGAIHWYNQRKQALMLLRRDATEHTALHELIHLRTEGHREQPKRYDEQYELAINALADALIREIEMWV